eukprot:9488329-Pyramimonas_sp.AAC.1
MDMLVRRDVTVCHNGRNGVCVTALLVKPDERKSCHKLRVVLNQGMMKYNPVSILYSRTFVSSLLTD